MFCCREPATVLILEPESAYQRPKAQVSAVAKGVLPFFRASIKKASWKRRIRVPGR